MPKGGIPPRERQALTQKQIAVLLDAVEGTKAYLFCMIGLYAGLRREEILGLKWDCVRLDKTPCIEVQRALRFEHNRPVVSDRLKTKASRRIVPIPPQLVQALQEENKLRSLCKVIHTSSGDRKIPLVASHGTASWVDEEGQIPESDDSFGQISLGAHKVASIIKVSEELLKDSVFDVESYIANEFARRVGDAEEAAFINGDGAGKPYGLLHDTNGATAGVTAASATAFTADELIDLVYSLKAPYRKHAIFLFNDQTLKAIRKLKDGNGQFLWQPGLQAGQPNTLLGYNYETSYHMPLIGAGKKPILFGDFSSYWIADREGRSIQRLNELYAATGQIGFRVTQRLDARLVQQEGMKCLAMKAGS